MSEILGIDLGTNSIGLALRNVEKGVSIIDQLGYFTTLIFKKGVGSGKSGEFSYAAERTKHRSSRRLYQARKYRIWATLDVLMKNGYCPINEEQLDQWRKYDKKKGLKREYPVDAFEFEQWVRLDFNGDGVADYKSPYQLRAELATTQFNLIDQINKYKLGRALYHIAQRRGFKSSKGETIKEQEKEAEEIELSSIVEIQVDLKRSEEKKAKDLLEYKNIHQLPTVGCCFDKLLNEGIRVRASKFQAVRSQFEEEIKYIFEFQNELELDSDFYKSIHKAIFYKRPLKSQKGLIGKCTLEPTKSRCPISHPEFESFRAWSFINSIQYRRSSSADWMNLSIILKENLFEDKFLRTKANFKFEEIREWIERKVGYALSADSKTINYKDKTNVAGCPISARFKNLLGEHWRAFKKETSKSRTNFKTGEVHAISYTLEDVWHVCFSFEDQERIEEFARQQLEFDGDKSSELVRLWSAIPQGYSMLSYKAIRNINRFLKKGLIYTDAVLLAKLPEILGETLWRQHEENLLTSISMVVRENRKEKRILNIVNTLIARYKSLEFDEQFAYKNTEYRLDLIDYSDIEMATIDSIGDKSWGNLSEQEKKEFLSEVELKYQQFFFSSKRDFYKLPILADSLKSFLSDDPKFSFLHCDNAFFEPNTKLPCKCAACRKLNLLYHPSQIEFYKPAKEQNIEWKGMMLSMKLLESPTIGAFKNPMAMRTLQILRKAINHLLKEGTISEDTRVVIETARDLNDANMRWAIEAYQREREKENKVFEDAIRELYNGSDRVITEDEIDKARILLEQSEIHEFVELNDKLTENSQKKRIKEKGVLYSKEVTKYRLWLEQGCRCIYTGKMINISDLFSDNKVDFEHTIPRSISFDNSLANLTVCDAHFNRNVKKNQLPSQLSNYQEILARLQAWDDKVERLIDNVNFWKAKAKQAQTKDTKDNAIRQRHLWEMELDYWKNKLGRFKMLEVTSGFKNSQLVDTRIITKYAAHYLKSVFNNVDVQKGRITSDFRKMLGVQSIDEKKSRDKHSHHAVDAAILTMIPSAAKRDKMLKLYYEIQEKERFEDVEELKYELEKERRSCKLGNVSNVSAYIEDRILINHVSKDQTLTPANRKVRKRGKEILYPNKDGVLTNRWVTGDCIRGQLHKDSWFGAIKYPLIENGIIQKDKGGKYVYPQDKNNDDIILMVKREPINSLKSEKDLEKIIDPYVRFSIEVAIKKRMAENQSFLQAISQPIWMLDKNNCEVRTDKSGNLINPIRHIRCKVAAGRGYFSKDKALEIKNQANVSTKARIHIVDRGYKQRYFAQNDGNYLCLLYEGINKGKHERKFKILSYFDIVQGGIKREKQIWDEPYFREFEEKKRVFSLSAILKVGTRVLMWEESPDELIDCDLSRRLFYVYKFNFKGQDCIYLQNHIEARKDSDIDEDFTTYNSKIYQPRLTMVANSFNCLIEHRDFEIQFNGQVSFINY